jgi:hypothetical protein
MALSSPITSNQNTRNETELPIDESTPLFGDVVPETAVNYAAVSLGRNDEEAQCLPDKRPPREIPRNVVGVISILLLGTGILSFSLLGVEKASRKATRRI